MAYDSEVSTKTNASSCICHTFNVPSVQTTSW
jgi:hypothetical protein